ncbi:MAG: CCA tRNA nucleotidyltransferase [Chloroflexi bacterium]|nr:CCA tRNA nucleotidyltransferase [Chloroflexota bacterium]
MQKNLSLQLERQLPRGSLQLIRTAGALAAERRCGLYLVGGAVRDILLGRDNFDLDLVVEGDAPELSRALAQGISGRVLVHQRFGTAKVKHDHGSIDLTTARSETYSRPGALPTVSPGSITDDLRRRDFTINAMAMDLSPGRFGALVDPFSGEADLRRGLISVLHDRSFVDDATRMLRAVRYEQRFSFRLEESTEALLRRDLPMLATISGDRLRHELELILKEDRPEDVLERAQALGLLERVHPSLKADGWLRDRYRLARSASPPSLPLYLALLTYRLGADETEDIIARLRIPGRAAAVMRDACRLKADLPSLESPGLLPSVIHRLLRGRSPASVLAAAVAADSAAVRERLELYLNRLRYVKTSLNGEALQQMGLSPGPQLGEMLGALHEAKLDGRVKTREDEAAFLRARLTGNQ